VSEIDKMGNEPSSLKGNKQGNNIRDEGNLANTWYVKEEISKLRMQLSKERSRKGQPQRFS